MNNFAPLPWKVVPYVDGIDIVDADGKPVLHLADRDIAGDGLPPANAEFVVRACNMHCEILKTLENLVMSRSIALAVIAKAKGGAS